MKLHVIVASAILSGCSVYGGIERSLSDFNGPDYRYNEPIGVFGAEGNTPKWHGWHLRGYLEHRSLIGVDDGHGLNVIGGRGVYTFQ